MERAKINEIVEGLCRQEPIQYLLGEAYFHGLTFRVTPAVLIPRPETAELVDRVTADCRALPSPRILDVGTGSGCIALSLAKALPGARVTGLDCSREALEVAASNARLLGIDLTLREADILREEPPRETLEVIVSNPPYVLEREKATMEANVLEHEPHIALFVPDEDPLRFYRAITRYARQALCPGGRLYFEINPLCREGMVELLRESGFREIEVMMDYCGKARFTIASL